MEDRTSPLVSEVRKAAPTLVAFAVGEGNQLSGATIPWLSELLFVMAAVFGAFWVWPHLTRWQAKWKLQSPLRTPFVPRGTVENLQAQFERATTLSPIVPSGPADMTIHDAFFHICPDVLDNPKEHRWEKIGDDLKDKLSTEQLVAWGREIDPDTKRLSALVAIPATYWPHAEFVYFFLDTDRRWKNDPHSWTPRNRPTRNDYADIRFSSEQILRLWPQHLASPKPAPRYTPYDIEQRLKAIDELYSVIESRLVPAYIAGRDYVNNLRAEVNKGGAPQWIRAHYGVVESAFAELMSTKKKYGMLAEVAAVLDTPWNYVSMLAQCDDLINAINYLSSHAGSKAGDFVDREIAVQNWKNCEREFLNFIETKKAALQSKRREYEAAQVHR